MRSLVALLACSCLVAGLPPPHPDVLAVRREESLLPPHQRSQALHNPHLQEVLPLTSLLHQGENLVFEREAHGVSRKEIYNILTHAGFIPRRNPQTHGDLQQPAVQQSSDPDFWNPPFLQSQDLLQYL